MVSLITQKQFFVISDEEKISCYLQKAILISNKTTLKRIKFVNLIDIVYNGL